MARLLAAEGRRVIALDAGWEMAVLPAGTANGPSALPPGADWVPAIVPGTASAALTGAGRVVPDLDASDIWYRVRIPDGETGRLLRLDGVATLWEAWLGDAALVSGSSMFLPSSAPLPACGGVLTLRCRALSQPAGLRRARWRPALVRPHWLRGVRTTLGGRMPGWSPGPPTVGPWRAVAIEEWEPGAPRVGAVELRATLRGDVPNLMVVLRPEGARDGIVACAGSEAHLVPGDDGTLVASLDLPDAAPWWPHTHGEPTLHAITATLDGARLDLGRTGFRRVKVDRGTDGRGFGLLVNGVPVFCRGGVWIGGDPGGVARDPRPTLVTSRDAGLNTVRVSGTGVWESDAFYDACDELGLLAWQDAPLASADFPEDDPAFRAAVEAEAAAFLDRVQASPSLVVLCGGSEVAQSAAMNGAPQPAWYGPLRAEGLPGVATRWRPDVACVPDSPCGPPDELPHRVDAGIAHYFGVGAYLRPPGDARAAGVRFASECLAFANPPGDDGAADLRLGVPRDPGATWDFADVRDHYLRELHGADPVRLRWEEPERYLALSRAVTGDLMAAIVAEWRRPGSPCRGALVWTLNDLGPGAGWGLVDRHGRAKPALRGLARSCAPLVLLLLDEGVSGIALHALNEHPSAVEGVLELVAYRGALAVARGERAVLIPARGSLSFGGEALFGRFFDAAYAWRFGPPACEATHAFLHVGGTVAAEAALYPQGYPVPPSTMLSARAERDGSGWWLTVEATGAARGVRVTDEAGFAPDRDWFSLAPGRAARLRMAGPDGAAPSGRVMALNAAAASYRGAA